MSEGSDAHLALIERQLEGFAVEMRELRASPSQLVALGERQTALLDRMTLVAAQVADHETRLREVEKHQPGLRETRTWLISAGMALASAAFTVALTTLTARNDSSTQPPRPQVDQLDRRPVSEGR